MAGFEQYILLMLGPVFVGFVLWELAWLRRHKERFPRANYSWADTLSNAALALLHQGGDALAAIAIAYAYDWFFGFRLFDISISLWSIVLLLLLQDFCYYWFHRASHRIRWFWASHVVHHSSESLNLSTAFRQSLTYPVTGMWLFWIPLLIIGFKPQAVVAAVLINLAYQFFVHTQLVGKLGKFEWLFNTPSHHCIHHARNPQYIDKNYGGVLIIWDRLFGTYVDEEPGLEIDYGILRQVHSHNPLVLTFHEWRAMLADVFGRGKTPGQRLKHLLGPPEWEG